MQKVTLMKTVKQNETLKTCCVHTSVVTSCLVTVDWVVSSSFGLGLIFNLTTLMSRIDVKQWEFEEEVEEMSQHTTSLEQDKVYN